MNAPFPFPSDPPEGELDPALQDFRVSVFAHPVSNTTPARDVGWPEFCRMATEDVIELSNSLADTKARFGQYFVRGKITGTRSDANLSECCALILDIDQPLPGGTLPTPYEIHDALSDFIHVVYSSATPGRSRIVVPVEKYPIEETAALTRALYNLCRSLGQEFEYSGESKTASQPWFYGQTLAKENHICLVNNDGEIFRWKEAPAPVVADKPTAPITEQPATVNHLQKLIDELKSGTIHVAAKEWAGWQCRTTNLTKKQIFDDLTTLIEAHCSDRDKVARWYSRERAELEEWFSLNVQGNPPSHYSAEDLANNSPQQIKDPESLLGEFEVCRRYVDKLGKEEALYPDLIIKRHVLTIIAMSGGGKTTFFYYHVAPKLADEGLKVYYVDADSPASEHRRMKDVADTHGFKFLNPDANEGSSMEKILKTFKAIADGSTDLDGWVVFFDTLKKCADLMSKTSVKEFYKLARKLAGRGATVILLGHANKFRDKSGNLVFEGVGDVRSDTDELIFFERKKNPNGGLDITTVVDPDKGAKVRGIFQPFSFHISEQREVTFYKNIIPPVDFSATATPKATEEEIVEAARKHLLLIGKPILLTGLAEQVAAVTYSGVKRVRQVLIRNAEPKDAIHHEGKVFLYQVGERNGHFYELAK